MMMLLERFLDGVDDSFCCYVLVDEEELIIAKTLKE